MTVVAANTRRVSAKQELAILLPATPFLLFPTVIAPISAVFCILLVLVPILLFFAKKAQLFPPTILSWFVIILMILLPGSVGVSADFDLTYPKLAGIILGLAWWRWLALYSHSGEQLQNSLFGFLAFASLLTGVGILSSAWPAKIPVISNLIAFLPEQLITLPGARAGGISTNQLAGTILLFWPLLLTLSFEQTLSKISKVILLTAALFFSFILVITQSRSGWVGGLAAIVTLLTYFAWQKDQVLKKRIALFGLLLVLSGCVFLIFQIGVSNLAEIWAEPPRETEIGSLNSLSFRREVWMWGSEALASFPLTGVGLGTFRVAVHRLFPIMVPSSYDIAHAHNVFLQVGVDFGFVGLFSYVGLTLSALVLSLKKVKETGILESVSIGICASLIAFHVYGFTDALALGSKPSILFWMLLGILTAVSSQPMVNDNKIVT